MWGTLSRTRLVFAAAPSRRPQRVNSQPSIVIINIIEFSIKKRIVVVAKTSSSNPSPFSPLQTLQSAEMGLP
jgi:hypothetical protein